VCLGDVVPAIVDALAREHHADIRHRLVVVLGRFSERDERARETLECVAASDPDHVLRTAANSVLKSGHTRSRKSLERLARADARRRRRRQLAAR
jgi:hypothetical protein